MPVVSAYGARQLQCRGLAFVANALDLYRPPGLHIHPGGPGDRGVGLCGQQFPGLPVQDVKETVLGRLHDDLARFATEFQLSQDHVLGGGIVPGFPGSGLVVPHITAIVRLEGDNRGQKQVIAAIRAANLPVPGRAVADPDVQEIEFRVVRHGVPDSAAAANHPPLTAPPGLGGPLEGVIFETVGRIARHRVKAPGHLAVIQVVGADITAHTVLAAAIADEQLVLDDARRAGNGVGPLGVGGLHLPTHRAIRRIQADQATVEGTKIQAPLVIGDTAINDVAAAVHRPVARHLGIEKPQQLSRAGVVGVHHAPGAAGINNAVDDQRGRFHTPRGGVIKIPGQPQLRDITRVDIGQRAEAPLCGGETVHGPFNIGGHLRGGDLLHHGNGFCRRRPLLLFRTTRDEGYTYGAKGKQGFESVGHDGVPENNYWERSHISQAGDNNNSSDTCNARSSDCPGRKATLVSPPDAMA